MKDLIVDEVFDFDSMSLCGYTVYTIKENEPDSVNEPIEEVKKPVKFLRSWYQMVDHKK